MNKNTKIFVYGSLREGFFNYNKYLKGNVLSNEKGKIKGVSLYHMPYKGYPAVFKGEGQLVGEIISLSDYDNVMKKVDLMEGYYGEDDPHNEYNKILVTVEKEDGTFEECYSYFYNVDNDNRFCKEAIHIVNGDWKEYMLSR